MSQVPVVDSNVPYKLANLLAINFCAKVGSFNTIADQAGQAVDIIDYLTKNTQKSPFSEVDMDQLSKIYNELVNAPKFPREQTIKCLELLLTVLTNNLLSKCPP